MKLNKNDPFTMFKSEITRALLEKVQGESLKHSMDTQETEVEKDDSVIEIPDNAYVNRNGVPLAMDIYKPNVAEDVELPVIVVVHGGGLVVGDRKISRGYAMELARRGYLVFTIEYRLVPRANVCDQLDDVCAGLDLIGRKLVDFNVDFTRMYLTADSAGAYLSIYVASMKKSKELQNAIGHEPSRMVFKGLGLMSGMFYTNRKDPIGALLADQFYGDKAIDERFIKYMDPEHREILDNLPPVFLVTSKGDFLNKYTLDFHEALKKNGNLSHLQYYGSDDLGHAFPAIHPALEESQDAIDKMVNFFDSKKVRTFKKDKLTRIEKDNFKKLQDRIASGEIVNQTAADFIKELNSYSEQALDRPAIEAGYKEYTYREMFERWDKYARAFSSVGISQHSKSKVGIFASKSEAAITALYALNMMGVSVVAGDAAFLSNEKVAVELLKTEQITDVIIFNDAVMPGFVEKFEKIVQKVDFRNIIVAKSRLCEKHLNPITSLLLDKNYVDICSIKGAVRMKSLLNKSDGVPINYPENNNCADAIIVHTTGTTKGINKPVPLSNVAINSAVLSIMSTDVIRRIENPIKTTLMLPYFAVFAFVNQIHLTLALSGEMQVVSMLSTKLIQESIKFGVNVYFIADMVPHLIDLEVEKGNNLDFSKVELFVYGGAYLSKENKEALNKRFAGFGSKAKIMVGYGLSETAGACILSDPEDLSDTIGYPIPGTKAKILDEEDGKFYDSTDGVHRGGLYLSSPSVSSGELNGIQFFALDEIDGEKYYNTNDAVESDETGKLRFLGRTNRYFVNNEGVRFDSGLIETLFLNEKDIKACVMVPRYAKGIHDTIPLLYVEHELSGEDAINAIKDSIKHIFIDQGVYEKSNLPNQVVFVDGFPYTKNGKINIRAVMGMDIAGKRYLIVPKKENDQLVDVELALLSGEDDFIEELVIPEELEKSFKESIEAYMNSSNMYDMLVKIDNLFEPKVFQRLQEILPEFDTSKVFDLLKVFFRADSIDYNYEDKSL